MRIGLTGGIASGKSTAARWWHQQSIPVIDTDALAHSLTGPGGSALPQLVTRFGPDLVSTKNGMDRQAMRSLILVDPRAKRDLEGVLHPLIAEEADRLAANHDWVIFDVPLLTETGRWRPRVDRVLVVDCSEATQIRRASSRAGWNATQAADVIRLQASRQARRNVADACLFNDADDLQSLHQQLAFVARNWGWVVKEFSP